MDLRRNMYMRWREYHQGPLMLVDNEPQEYMTTHQTRSWLARPNKKGGSEMGKYSMSGGMMKSVCLPDAEYSLPPEEGPLLPMEGWLHTLHPKGRETRISQETRIDSQTMRTCSPNKKGGTVGQPPRCHPVHWLNRPQNYPMKC